MRRAFALLMVASLTAVTVGCGSDDSAVVADGGLCQLRPDDPSMVRVWNDAALSAIRLDFPAPTVHARNLYHLSAAMWDVWAAYGEGDETALFVDEQARADDIGAARNDAIAFASYRLLSRRYTQSLGAEETEAALTATLGELCGVVEVDAYVGDHPRSAAAFGLKVGDEIYNRTLDDGSREATGYDDPSYMPVNPPLVVAESGTVIIDPDRWQPLLLELSLSQNGLPLPNEQQTFVGSHWGAVTPFAIGSPDPSGVPSLDPGPPPRIAVPGTKEDYRLAALDVIRASSELCAGVETIDIGPSAYGANTLGVDDGSGHEVDPTTGVPYPPNLVDAADYYRSIAEYWADGPTSETPPGHWNVLANDVSDALPDSERRIGGVGEPVDRLEWDVKLDLSLNGALHDAAITAWGVKRYYDSVRPISMIRWMGQNGVSDDGLPLEDGLVEVITAESSAPGERHEDLADHVGEVAIYAWRGSPENPRNTTSCVGWIRAVDWVPYQRATFVTPAFASYVSGHSVFSRSGAEVLAAFTGSEFFPGGVLTHDVPKGSFLHEEGPSVDTQLQWATYFDASDEAGRSRIWGGIHIRADDRAGRLIGHEVGRDAWARAQTLFAGQSR